MITSNHIKSISIALLAPLWMGTAHGAASPTLAERLDRITATASGSPMTAEPKATMSIVAKEGGKVYRERVQSDRTYLLTTHRTLSQSRSASRRVDADLDEVLAAANASCDADGGRIRILHDDVQVGHYEPVMQVWVAQLLEHHRIGRYWCMVGEVPSFELTIRPSTEARASMMPVGFAWPVRVILIEGRQFEQFERRRVVLRERAQVDRASAVAGGGSAVPTTLGAQVGER